MKRSILLFCLVIIIDGCVDRLYFDINDMNGGSIIIDALITDQPGPYTVKLSRSSNADDNLNLAQPVPAKEVVISDDSGYSEILQNRGSGIFETKSDGIQGEIGKTYAIRIELLDGTIFESTPEKLSSVAEIDSIYYEFESFLPLNGQTEYGFRVYMDTKRLNDNSEFMRWRFTGTYVVRTYPEFHRLNSSCLAPNDPLPCSGVEWTGSFFKRFAPCTCCFCWVNDYEKKPRLSNDQIGTNGTFKKIEMGYVPIDEWTFSNNKYMVKVEQMSLSKTAYEFWKIFKDQKEGVTSIFQPSQGKARTNIFSTNSNKEAIGIFYATSVKKKITFITGADSPINLPQHDIPPEENCPLYNACDNIFLNAFREPPPDWK